ncbi:hypothetical protein Droror1_Dr00005338 [Drosera rotundifolia]
MNMWAFMAYLLLGWISINYILCLLRRSRLGSKKLPPGPFPLPVFGNVLDHIVNPHQSLAKLSKVYGPVVTVQLGSLNTVVISSVAMAKQVLQKHDLSFSTRNPWVAVSVLDHHKSSVAFLPPESHWRSLRRVSKTYIFANSKLDASRDLRRKKVEQLVSYVKKCSETCTVIGVRDTAVTTSLNLMTNTFFSLDSVQLTPGSRDDLKELVCAMVVEAGTLSGGDFFPILKLLDPQGINHRSTKFMTKMFKLFNSLIEERLRSREAFSAQKNDVLEAIIGISEGENKQFDLTDIPHLLLDLFVAGTDTTSTTFEWAMAELIHNPEKLKKARAEIEEVIGKGKLIKEDDIERLPYLQAIVKETLRMHPPVAFLIPRKVLTDVELCEFTVPKNSQVLVNIWGMGRDESLWKDANIFQPERFLDSKIDVKGGDFELIPFGAGRRICPGMPLANRMLPYMLASVIQNYEWKPEGEVVPEKMNMDEKFGFTVTKAQPLRAIPIRL